MSARTRELFGLLPVSLLVSAGFAAVLITRSEQIQDATLTYGAVFLGLCVVGAPVHQGAAAGRRPLHVPAGALLAAVGLVEIYRIDPELAREQAQWFVVGLAFFCATVVFLRDHHVLERYRYTIAAASIGLLLLPRLPGIGAQVNGAFLAIKLGPIQFQPAEFAKLGIIVFLASYLRETGAILVRPRLRPLPYQRQLLCTASPASRSCCSWCLDLGCGGSVLLLVFVFSFVAVVRERPSPKHFGPLLLVWGLAMLMLIVIRDLGSSLMFFGGFLALLYVATARLSLVGVGATMFFGGAFYLAQQQPARHERVDTWLDPFQPGVVDHEGYQIAQSLFAQADGGLFGQGFGQALLELPGRRHDPACRAHGPDLRRDRERGRPVRRGRADPRLPAVRLPRLQDRAHRQRRLLEAAGHRAHLGARAPGVRDRRRRHARDPAHRRDAAVRLLRRQLDRREHGAAGAAPDRVRPRARRARPPGRPGVNRQITQLFGLFALLFGVLVVFTSRWTVFEAKGLEAKTANRRPLIEEQKIPRGLIFALNGTVLARSVGTGSGEDRIYTRDYPTGPLFSHAVGYSFIR